MEVKEEVKKTAPAEPTEKKTKKNPAKGSKKKIRNTIIIVVVVAILFGAFFMFQPKDEESATAVISAHAATRGDVVNYLSGSGMIEAMDSYDIVAKVQGDILSAPFEEGEIVEKDSVLYVFESEDAQQSVQSQQNSYDSQKISYEAEQKKWERFKVKAPVSGYVQGIPSSLHIGDEVQNGEPLAVINASSVEISVPFAASAAEQIHIGDTAQLSSAKYMTNSLQGTVTAVDGAYGGSFHVRITFKNPGQIVEGDTFGATIGGIQSISAGSCSLEEAVKTEIKGEIVAIHAKNGDYVEKGTLLFELDDEDTKNSLRQNQISFTNAGINLKKAYDSLDNYTIKSPITGTVIQKNYKAGDTLGNSANSAVLATIADVSKMKFTINVDELDIGGVQLGQRVAVTADAIEGKTFEGEITKIIQQGSGTSGVTTYPVEVTIAEPGELKIGMNVTGTIVMSSASNVIKVPIEAVTMRGGKSYVYVLRETVRQKVYGDKVIEEASAPKAETQPTTEAAIGDKPAGERPNGQMPEAEPATEPETEPETDAPKKEENEYTFTDEDFELREVTTGVSSDSEIEILTGLAVGEYVKVVQTVSTGGFMGFGSMGGMSGMPAGGMGGNRTGGNMGGNMGGNRTGGYPGR